MSEYPAEIRRLIYTTNTVEGYNRQVRKVTKTKGALPNEDAARKLLFLVNREITKDWTASIFNWAKIRNQLAVRFEGRFPL
ncbi:MAG: Transposase [uncultured Chloroflexia bacterium]|uniref:Mutator family transposase n=1 Tax=uncultured Chloroflexia bacterium TaxID=1672391 RepID=A0A6J4MUR9_9CHLR|nr:MAG: Transposase [uncultured Chloroflexia bacterium]